MFTSGEKYYRFSSFWYVDPGCRNKEATRLFNDMKTAANLSGETVTASPISLVRRVWIGNECFYIKIYTKAGKGLRRYIGRSRARAEWENLLFFRDMGIPTADLVALGQETCMGFFRRSMMITREILNCRDLAEMARDNAPQLADRKWVAVVSDQVADIARKLHCAGFVHNDFKWRNLLVTTRGMPKIFLIDCPAGRKPFRFWFDRWVVKDLACLDKVAKHQLRRTQRLRFFMRYTGSRRLDPNQKRMIRNIVNFFQGRE